MLHSTVLLPHLHAAEHPEVIRYLLAHLVLVSSDKRYVLLAQICPRSSHVVLVLKKKVVLKEYFVTRN